MSTSPLYTNSLSNRPPPLYPPATLSSMFLFALDHWELEVGYGRVRVG